MSVHEFKVNHLSSELMSILNVPATSGVGPEVYANMLQKNMKPYITTQVSAHSAKIKIAESTRTPEQFLRKYDELKSKNVRELDPLVDLLAKLCTDTQTKEFLEKNATERAAAAGLSLTPHSEVTAQLPVSGSDISPQQLSNMKEILLQQANTVAGVIPSEVLAKMNRENHENRVNLPEQPDWLFERAYLTMDFVTNNREQLIQRGVQIGTLPLALQERAIIEDVLYCMGGTEGEYIIALPLEERYAKRQFKVDSSLDVSLQELVKRMLPFFSHYSTVVRFIEEKSAFEYGLVNQALSAAMRSLVKNLKVLVSQLEEQLRVGKLTLQKLWFYIQPTMWTFEILSDVSESLNKGACIGGAVLSILHNRTSLVKGDPKSEELCLYLTQAACVPYFEILEKWIYKGIIADPFHEFLIEADESFQKEKLQEDYNDSYWNKHYGIRRERIPVFLERVVDKILNTGKYLNVVRQSGRDITYPHAEEIVYTLKDRLYFEHIEKAYSFASELLLNLLIDEYELMARFRSVKHYFLMDQGDLIVQFMDMADDEMKRNVEDIMPTRLESLLELALRTSTANIDPFKDDVKVNLLPCDLITQLLTVCRIQTEKEKEVQADPCDLNLSGLEAFSFDYIVKWPLSLVLNRQVLTRYQMLFRHLFYCKHVERTLCNVWISNKSAKMFTLQTSRWYAVAFALRQRMLNFVQNFEYYMMFEVIEPYWHQFQEKMNKVSNVDDVLKLQSDFLDVCFQNCMLTSPQLLKIFHKLMMVCVTFSNCIQRLNESAHVDLDKTETLTSTLQAVPTAKDRKQDPKKKKVPTATLR